MALRIALVGLISLLLISCASNVPLIGRSPAESVAVIEFTHTQSAKTSDCLAVCAGMVMDYYGMDRIVPDSTLPLDLMEFSNSLNSEAHVDGDGHVLFSAVMGMTSEDIVSQITMQRPLIIAYRPTSSEEYHSVVITGADSDRKRFLVNDPARSKPGWVKMSKFPTFADSGMYLVMVIGLREI